MGQILHRRKAFRTAGFDPDSISGLVLWFDANDLSAVGDGNPVGTWSDKSSSGNDATATTTQRPLYKSNGIGTGLPSVLFDGTDDRMSLGSTQVVSGGGTMFAVYKKVTSGAYAIPLGGAGVQSCLDFSDGDYYWITKFTSVLTTAFTADTNPNVMAQRYASGAGNYSGSKNGSEGTSAGSVNDTDFAYLGYRAQPLYSSAHFGEILLYSSRLGDADFAAVEDYLGAKWGVTIS